MKHGSDGDKICSRCARNDSKSLGIGTGRVGNRRTRRDQPKPQHYLYRPEYREESWRIEETCLHFDSNERPKVRMVWKTLNNYKEKTKKWISRHKEKKLEAMHWTKDMCKKIKKKKKTRKCCSHKRNNQPHTQRHTDTHTRIFKNFKNNNDILTEMKILLQKLSTNHNLREKVYA